MAILDKKDLACYIIRKYQDIYGKEISPIKLQKSLYFLFAMWGGKIADAQCEGDEDTEDDEKYKNYDRYLFDASFEAWKYGPVDREIYDLFKEDRLLCTKEKLDKMFNSIEIPYIEEVKAYIDDLLPRIFEVSDFGLVDLSHADKCWEKVVNATNNLMSNNDIIREYQVIKNA